MRNYHLTFLFLVVLCNPITAQKPNFVLIMADDCTVWDIGAYGSKDAITPNIDRLATEGMMMERCYQAAPMCSPTRHNLLTGISPVKSGAYPNHTRLDSGVQSVGHHLGALGYNVALAGKRHIGPRSAFPMNFIGEGSQIDFTLVEKYLGERKTDEEPFALFLMSNEPHTPWDKGDVSLFDRKKIELPYWFPDTKATRANYVKYLAEINYLDGQVGKAMTLLEKYGFDENTLVIFLSEQGSSWPLAKWTLYEAGVKSAMIAWMPNKIKAGVTSKAIVEYQDILPTFIEMAGGTVPGEIDGKSLLPVLNKSSIKIKDYSFSIQTTRGIIKGSDHFGIRSVVGEDYRYIWNLTPEVPFLNAVNNGKNAKSGWFQTWISLAEKDERAAKIVHKYKYRPGEVELYNIKKDKWCMDNLANDPAYDEIKEELKNELVGWMKKNGDLGKETEMLALEHRRKKKK